MQSRRDQVDAHNYLLARLNSALVRADPDSIEPPGRRDTRAFAVGLVLMLLACAGVAGWALFFDSGSTAWKQAGVLIVDEDTGSRYLLDGNRLEPVLNLASARLLVGSQLSVESVSSDTLDGLARGTAVGIAGAPDMLPSTDLLNTGVWRVCLAPVSGSAATVGTGAVAGSSGAAAQASAGADPGLTDSGSALTDSGAGPAGGAGLTGGSGMTDSGSALRQTVGDGPAPGATPAAGAAEVGGTAGPGASTGAISGAVPGAGQSGSPDRATGSVDLGGADEPFTGDLGLNVQIGQTRSTELLGTGQGLLVSSAGKEYLIWNDQRLLVTEPWVADVLGYATATPIEVPAAWLNLVPRGPDLEPVSLSGEGTAGPVVGGEVRHVGDLLSVTSAGVDTHYVVTRKGLAALNRTEYALASARTEAGQERAISAADLAAATRVSLPQAQQELPVTPPQLNQSLDATMPCLEYPGTGPDGAAQVTRASVAQADRPQVGGTTVTVTSGGGGLVGTDPDAAADEQTLTLVDDGGTAYALSDDAVSALGYSADEAIYVPADWLAVLPQGPGLSTPGEG